MFHIVTFPALSPEYALPCAPNARGSTPTPMQAEPRGRRSSEGGRPCVLRTFYNRLYSIGERLEGSRRHRSNGIPTVEGLIQMVEFDGFYDWSFSPPAS